MQVAGTLSKSTEVMKLVNDMMRVRSCRLASCTVVLCRQHAMQASINPLSCALRPAVEPAEPDDDGDVEGDDEGGHHR